MELCKSLKNSPYDYQKIVSLVSECSDPNFFDEDGCTPLYYSVQCHYSRPEWFDEIFFLLLNKGAKVNITCGFCQNSPLKEVIYINNYLIFSTLLKLDIDIEQRDRIGWTVLHTAVMKNNYMMVKDLISAGANVKSKSTRGRTVLDILNYTDQRDEKMKKLISKAFAQMTAQPKFYVLTRFLQQRHCGILVGTRICNMMGEI